MKKGRQAHGSGAPEANRRVRKTVLEETRRSPALAEDGGQRWRGKATGPEAGRSYSFTRSRNSMAAKKPEQSLNQRDPHRANPVESLELIRGGGYMNLDGHLRLPGRKSAKRDASRLTGPRTLSVVSASTLNVTIKRHFCNN